MVIMLVIGSICAPAPASAAVGNLVVNGGFEQANSAPNSWGVLPTITGWSTAYGAGIELQNAIAGAAHTGT